MHSTNYVQVTASRDIQGTAFSKSTISIPWSYDNSTYFNPYRSFIKIRCSFTDGPGDDKLNGAFTVAPSMFIGDCFWQSIRMKINDKVVSEYGDYVGQCAALKHRMYTPEEELSNWHETTNFSQTNIFERATAINSIGETNTRYTTNVMDLSEAFVLNDNNGPFRGATDNIIIANGATAGESVITIANATLLAAEATVRAGDQLVIHTQDDTLVTIVRVTGDETIQVTPRLAAEVDAAYVLGNVSYVPNIIGAQSEARNKQDLELIWKPPIGFFDIDSFVPCCDAKYVLELIPHPENIYKQMVIQALTPLTPGTQYNFSVQHISMWLLQGMGAPISKSTIELDYREIRCQSQQLFSTNLSQKTFQVHPRADALTIAYQTPLALTSDTRYSLTKFTSEDEDELALTQLYIKFGTKQLPNPIPDIQFDSDTDFLVQRYVESIMYANALRNPEPYYKWLDRGPYYHFSGYSNQDKEGRCYVSQQFSVFDGENNPNVLLFDHFDKKIKLGIEGGVLGMVMVDQ